MDTTTNHVLHQPEAPSQAQSRLHLFVLIDALGWKLLESHEFLSDILPHRKPLRTVLGFSSGAIPTILTGMLPSQTGHWNLYYYDPKGSPFRWMRYFSFLPERLLDNRVGHKMFKEMGRRLLGLGPMFECLVSPKLLPFFSWVEKRNIYGEKAISGGHSIFDQLAKKGIPYKVYSYHRWSDAEILERAKVDITSDKSEFFFIYLSEIDHYLHDHWGDDRSIQDKLDTYARQLREILRLAQQLDNEVTMTVFSDHGMTPVSQHYDIIRDVESLSLRMPDDYLAIYDSTMARFWLFNDRSRQRVQECLSKIGCGRILDDEELKQLGILFADRRYGEIIFLLDPGWMFARSDFHGQWMPIGMHGYHPDDAYSDAIFLSNRDPGEKLSTIADIYRCLSVPLTTNATRG